MSIRIKGTIADTVRIRPLLGELWPGDEYVAPVGLLPREFFLKIEVVSPHK